MRLRGLAVVALVVAFATQPAEAAWNPHQPAPTLPSPGAGAKYAGSAPSKVLPPPRLVDVRAIAKRPGRTRANQSLLKPIRTMASPATISGPHAVEMASAFEGLSLAQNDQLYGPDQDVEPADAQIAASPSALVEIAGNTMALFSPTGALQWTVDIEALFRLPAGYDFYAPSLQYDWGSGRWFLGGIASNGTVRNSWMLMAVSRTGSPFGTWSLIITDAHINQPVYYMRESIAVVGDKVVQAEQADNCSNGCFRIQGQFLVMRKSQLVAGVQPATDQFDMGSGQFDFLAVQPQSVGGTYADIAFLVWLKGGVTSPPDRLGLLQVTGLPYLDRIYSYRGTTTVWEKDFSATIATSNVLPAQPGGSLYASPTPITSAIYRDGQVVLAMNDGCGQVDCVRIDKIANFGNATPVANSYWGRFQNTTVPAPISPDLEHAFGLANANLFDASLAIDPYGNLFLAAAFSSSTENPGMAVAGISAPVSQTSTVMPTSRIVEGPSSYSCFSNSSNLWGAFMRSVPDPNNYRHVWMPAEAAVDSCWATAVVSATTGVGPQAVKMSPGFGSTNGGQEVQIDGSFFVPDADQVLFGTNPGTIVAESSNVIFVSAPPGVAGQVAVTVQTPDGTSTAGTFTYITPGRLDTPPISLGVHWR